ncbi:hypothetical protein LIER_41005 [Lithospermum erythrorhizon]|uniref:Uncharacterized protein n=1 Tax=Lithospermum erythrorhizon TaxID=34254 RepID=A0AAV3R6T4_LITER
MQSPQTQKEVQRLIGRIAALTRFISPTGDRTLPFFKSIKKGRDFEWTPEYEQSFQEPKAYLQSPQLLARLVAGDVLQLYLVVSESALSSVLIREEDKGDTPEESELISTVVAVEPIGGSVTYELETLEGRQVSRSWNACHLRKYYM